ncbi:MAG: TVP38/TMEM64 family protein [Wenzhouxiangella sp.]
MSKGLARLGLVVGLLLGAALVILAVTLGQEAALDMLKRLERITADHYWATLLAFAGVMVVLVVLAAPVGTLFSLAGGYLFGILGGTAAALAGASLGAFITFLIARKLDARRLREPLDDSVGEPLLNALERDAFWTLLMLRIIPFAPFFPVNAAAAVTRIPAKQYALLTTLGLAPITLIYAIIGDGLGSIAEAGELADGSLWLEPKVWVPLGCLLLMTGFGLYWKRRRLRN